MKQETIFSLHRNYSLKEKYFLHKQDMWKYNELQKLTIICHPLTINSSLNKIITIINFHNKKDITSE